MARLLTRCGPRSTRLLDEEIIKDKIPTGPLKLWLPDMVAEWQRRGRDWPRTRRSGKSLLLLSISDVGALLWGDDVSTCTFARDAAVDILTSTLYPLASRTQ